MMDSLEHYGVPGMKWGIRKNSRSPSSPVKTMYKKGLMKSRQLLSKFGSKKVKDLNYSRKFVADVKRLAKKRGLNVFVVTDGASGYSNNGNPAVRNARNAQIQWELANGADPYEDWGKKKR